jgi:carboxypeptidase family protein/TonB-dependent receptor-like protein
MFARIGVLLLAFALALTGAAAAQETTGSIGGRVVDTQGLAVPGATITITGAQGARTLTTDNEGRYFAPFLVPGLYTVRGELSGFRAVEQRDITVSLSGRREVNLELQPGGVTETVQVTGSAPTVDTSSTTAGNVLDSETLQHLPIGRSLASTLYIVPGVTMSVGINGVGGNANPSIGGASGLENIYVVDGVNITDTGFGGFGAYNSVFGSLGAGVTSDFIKETEIKTGGFEAEFGQTTGGVVNVITKSGGNRFAGSLFGYTRPSALEASWKQLVTPNGTVNTDSVDDHDIGFSLGGPIVTDRLFFFGTYNPQWQQRGFTAPPGFPYASLGVVDRKRTIQAYAGKLSAQMNGNHRFDLSLFGDPSKGVSGLQRYTTLRRIAYAGAPGTTSIEGGYSELEYGGHNQTVRYDGIFGSSWLLEANLANSSNKFNEIPTVDDWYFQDLRFTPNGTSGGLGSYERDEGSNFQYGLKSTHILNGLGNHHIRYGVGLESIEFTRDFDYSGPNLTLGDGRTTVTGGPIQIRTGGGVTFFRATRGKLVPTDVTNQEALSFFLQDTWQMGRLTFRPGVRYERQELSGVDPAGPNPDLCFEGDSRPGQGDGTGPAIPCSFAWKNWSPRIGATFDLLGNGRAKVFGSYGRFYAKVPNDLAARSMSADAGITRQNYRDAALRQPVANGTSFAGTTTHLLTAGLHAAPIDPDSESTYKNEYLAGIEFDVMQSTNLGFRFVRRNMPLVLEDFSDLPLAGYFLDECATASVEYAIANIDASIPTVTCGLLTSAFEGPTHTYNAFEVTLNRRLSGNWAAIASYRFAKLEGNFEGFFRSDNGQSDPAITSLFDFPTNDPTYVQYKDVHGGAGDIRYQGDSLGTGLLPNDRPHQLKLYGNYIWNNFNVGLGFNAVSGGPLTALAGNPAYANAGEIPLTVRGEGIQTVDGFKDRTPVDVAVDLHADYAFQLGTARRVTVLADIFNLFNRRTALNYDNWSEITFGIANPNFGQPTLGGGFHTNGYQAPMSFRFGARFDW